MASIYDIVQGLSQAAANAYDGAHNEEGDLVEAGLQREQGNPLIDKRVIDGFNVKFFANKMVLTYQSEVQLKEVYTSGFEAEMDQRLADITSFLKKEYRKITKSSVKLKQEGDIDVRVESSSRQRSWVIAGKTFIIEGADVETVPQYSDDKLQNGWQSFLDQGGLGKKAKNDKRPKSSGE